MTSSVLLRLAAGGRPMLRNLALLAVSLGLGGLVLMLRWAVSPAEFSAAREAVFAGAGAFLVAGWLAAMPAMSLWELRDCAFARLTPGLLPRAVRELWCLAAVVVGVAAGTGGLGVAGGSASVWLLPSLAALGFGLGVFNQVPPRWWESGGGVLGLLAACVPLYLLPELVVATAGSGWAWLVAALALSTGGVVFSVHKVAKGGVDSRAVSLAVPGRAAPASDGGVQRERMVRTGDLDWLHALLHERYGMRRGGVVGSGLRTGLGVVIVLVLTLGCFAVVRSLAGTWPPSAVGEPAGAAVGWAGLDWMAGESGRAAWESSVFSLVVLFGVFASSAAILPGQHVLPPVSRRRLARLVWLRTQVEEVVMLAGMVGAISVLTVALARLPNHDPWEQFRVSVTGLLFLFAALPVARWTRLHWFEAQAARGTGRAGGTPMVIVLLVNSVVFAIAWNWGVNVKGVAAWLPALAVVLLIRWLWWWSLRRFFLQQDLQDC